MQLLYNNITTYNSCIEREDIIKKWIHSSTDLKDDYNVSRYLPKFCLLFINEIEVEPDFDYDKNRSVNHYIAYLNDGGTVSANGIDAFVKAIKNYVKDIRDDKC